MPTVTTDDGIELYYETAGEGEVLAFVGEAGLGAWQWGWQYGSVAGPRRAVVWDLRGTGRSESPPGPYEADRLAADLEAVLSAAGVRRAHLVGVGLGGMVALRYARLFSRAKTLTLLCTANSGSAVDVSGLRALCGPGEGDASLSRGFTAEFRAARPDLLEEVRAWRAREDARAAGFDGQLAAVRSFESTPLYELTLPALVVHGTDDPIVDVADGRALAEGLPGGQFVPVEGRHLCFIEHSRAVTDRLLRFVGRHGRGEPP